MNGYHNRLAWIDLTERRVEVRPLEERLVEDFIGGASLGAALLAGLINAETDPLSPENPLIFMTGPFTATRAPSGERSYRTEGRPHITGSARRAHGRWSAKLFLALCRSRACGQLQREHA